MQAGMVDALIGVDYSGEALIEVPAANILAAERWARLAASHGGNGDIVRLAGVLMLCAHHTEDELGTLRYSAEAAAHLAGLADDGDEVAARVLNEVSEAVPPEALSMAATANRQIERGE
jgi:hypothetical protein